MKAVRLKRKFYKKEKLFIHHFINLSPIKGFSRNSYSSSDGYNKKSFDKSNGIGTRIIL